MEVVLGFDWPENEALSSCFKLQLPAAWARKPCIKLIQFFLRQYKGKYENEEHPLRSLRASDLDLLQYDGTSIDRNSLISETLTSNCTELVVALQVEVERRLTAPIIVAIGEVETVVGVAGEPEPRAVVPTYVKEVFLCNHLSAEVAAGGSTDEKRCKNPGQRPPYYPVGSCGIKSYKPLVTELQKAQNNRIVSNRGWKDVVLIFRNAILEANLDMKNRHVIVISPSRAPLKFRSDAMEFFFRQYGVQSVAVVPLSAAAMVNTAKNSSTHDSSPWIRTACVVELGHDSSCALASTAGAPEYMRWTLRGGSEVSHLFSALVDSETSNTPIDAREESRQILDHSKHLLKKRHCYVRDLDAPNRHVRAIIGDVLVSEACYLASETLFAADDGIQAGDSLQHIVAETIMKIAEDKKDGVDIILLENIIVTGWLDSCLRGADRRLAQELYRLTYGDARIRVSRSPVWESAVAMAAELVNPDSATAWVVTREEFVQRQGKIEAKDPRRLFSTAKGSPAVQETTTVPAI